MELWRDQFAPDAAGASYREVLRFSPYKRAGQTTDKSLLEFDALRHEAEARMLMGRGFHIARAYYIIARAACMLSQK